LDDHLSLDRREGVNEFAQSTATFSRFISAMRRQSKLLIACCLVGLGCGTAYLMTATRIYTASADIIIDNRQLRAVHDVSTFADTPPLDAPEIESQLE
jgi:succinoglycan biosynthesis transport protein ExoP